MKQNSTNTIVITGAIGSGKSTVTKFLRDKGFSTYSADEIVHSLYRNDRALIKELCNRFGEEIKNTDGSVNRNLLRKKVMNDKKEIKWLNSIVHKKVFKSIEKLIDEAKTNSSYIFIEIPLIDEQIQKYNVIVWVVDANTDDRAKRVMERQSISLSEVDSIMANQKSREEYLKYADYVISNKGSIKNLFREVSLAIERYLDEKMD